MLNVRILTSEGVKLAIIPKLYCDGTALLWVLVCLLFGTWVLLNVVVVKHLLFHNALIDNCCFSWSFCSITWTNCCFSWSFCSIIWTNSCLSWSFFLPSKYNLIIRNRAPIKQVNNINRSWSTEKPNNSYWSYVYN